MTKQVWTEQANTNVKELFHKNQYYACKGYPVVDKDNFLYRDVYNQNFFIKVSTKLIKPDTLGGLATPLGVYITDGKHQAGAGNLGLFLTGLQ